MSVEMKEAVKEALKEHFGDTSPDCLVRIVDPETAKSHSDDHELVGRFRKNLSSAVNKGVQTFILICFVAVAAVVAYSFGWRPQ